MTSSKATPKAPAPKFLTESISDEIKVTLRTAYAMYLVDSGNKPEKVAEMNMKPKMLLSYLRELDPRWKDIDEAQVITTNRTLIQGMNTELNRFKKKIE